MPRKHKRLLGSRAYRNYSAEKMEEALEAATEGTLSLREASRRYKIPFGTLHNKFKGKHGRKPGRPPVFTEEEELAILQSAAKCGDWGFPLNLMDIRMMSKYYLDSRGKIVNRFKNNLPDVDWTYSLLDRHKDTYGQRLATNIKKSKSVEKTIKDLPSSNIFNYDESNLSDDPGKKRGIYRRGVKYPEKVMNHSKSCTTLMVCGSADGTLLPPYVVFKSLHLYDSWKENGPQRQPCCDKPCCSLGTRYNRTTSGWMDGSTFRDWFKTCFLPHAKRLDGRKALIGDNLSSHMDVEVLQMCAVNNIDFICLVPNSTHLCQPLDVGFFRPLKEAWRSTLTEWKLQNARLSAVPKDMFSGLLKKTLKRMNVVPARAADERETSAIKRNLISSFRSSGIFPIDREQVFKKLPNEVETEDPTNGIESALTSYLKEQRFGTSALPQRKKKRLNVAAGCSISTSALSQEMEIDDADEPQPSSSKEIEERSSSSSTTLREFQVGQFVLGKFATQRGKKTYKYLCKVIERDVDIVIVGLKSIGKNKRQFRLVPDDVSVIKETDIIEIYPNPSTETDSDGNLFYKFETEVAVVEV